MTGTHAELRARAVHRFRWMGLIVPLALVVVLSAVQFVLLPWMPDPVATHWGFTGEPNGYGPAWTFPVMTLVIGGGVTALLGGLTLSGVSTTAGQPISFKLMSAFIWGAIVLVVAMPFALFIAQAGTDGGRDAPGSGLVLLGGVVLALVLGFVAWRLSLQVPGDGSRDDPPEAVELAPDERAVWLTRVSMARVGLILLAVGGVVIVGSVLIVALSEIQSSGSPGAGTWAMAAVAVLVLVVVATSVVFDVRVDHHGLTVRSPLGWPRVRIAHGDIRGVEVVSVDPMGEYGGWGWRYGIGSGWGVVMRVGEALRVTRRNGKVFTVTVDDADTGAALLKALTDEDADGHGRSSG